jgi:hypothetical protein
MDDEMRMLLKQIRDGVSNVAQNNANGAQNNGNQSQRKITPWGDDNPGGREIIDKQKLTYNEARETTGENIGRVHDESTPSLRPLYGIAGAESVVPSTNAQIRSDLEFDLFSQVQPGHGEGADNKMFLYQQARERGIRYKTPMYDPNVWLGPSNYQHPMPWQWQNVKQMSDIANSLKETAARNEAVVRAIAAVGEGSAQAFGRDVGEIPLAVSDSGLPRDPRSIFEPVIQNSFKWTPVKTAAGKDLDRLHGFKRPYSAQRNPFHPERQIHNGGPVMKKRRALEVILQ